MNAEFTTIDQTIDFINQFVEHGDRAKVCKKMKYDKSNLTKMLKGKRKPRFDVLKELKKIAEQNYRKVN